MPKVAVGALTGAALDWLVAKCEGADVGIISPGWVVKASYSVFGTRRLLCPLEEGGEFYSPSTIWEQGGPIIQREITKIFRNVGGTWTAMILKDVPIPPEDRGTSLALTHRVQWSAAGPSPLIAALRCYVASKLGDLIEIPEKLFE